MSILPETSIIIRTKNEEKWLGECLRRLQSQTYQDFEIIIVDSGSTDRTLETAENFSVRIVPIKPEDFSYPYALNYGCREAFAEKYFVFLSAHSLPISTKWLEDGLSNFKNDKVMGACGFVWALPDGSRIEKFIQNKFISRLGNSFRRRRILKNNKAGLHFTNTIINKDLWDEYNFNESYGLGGEDVEWTEYWIKRGYVAVKDIKFSVYHSHGLGLKNYLKQQKYWKSLYRPQPYRPLEFRNKN